MVYLLWQKGYSVTAIDLVPIALERMRTQFDDNKDDDDDDDDDDGTVKGWTSSSPSIENHDDQPKESSTSLPSPSLPSPTIWTHSSGRAVQYVGDAVRVRPELYGTFDGVYDKDAFGAIPPTVRQSYCARLADYMKPGAILYLEVKHRTHDHATVGRDVGPPFSLTQEDIMDDMYFGKDFDYIASLGPLYDGVAIASMKQTGHILQRKQETK
jgi:hypothetical protein